MTHTLYVLLAAGALGAPGDAACPCSSAAVRPASPSTQAAPATSGGVLGWMRNLFGKRQPTAASQTPPATQAQVSRSAPRVAIQPTAYSPAQLAIVTQPRQTNQATAYSAPQGTTVTQPMTVTTARPNFGFPSGRVKEV